MGWVVKAGDGVKEDELRMGVAVEREHLDTIKWLIKKLGSDGPAQPTEEIINEVVSRIAQDHLKELPDYYTRLKEMEK